MFSQEKEENIESQSNGNFLIARNSTTPPTPIQGILFKEGHVFKTWKQRLIIVENGVLTYYSLKNANLFQTEDKVLKGTYNLRGYSILKTQHEMYLWPSTLGVEGKDLKLHTSTNAQDNPYPMKVWVAAIRSHIRYAQETYCKKYDWYPFYQAVCFDASRSSVNTTKRATTEYYRKKVFQVVRRDGVNVEKEIDSGSGFVSFKRYHEFVEINETVLNLQNDCRGKLSNGEGWATISTLQGSIVLLELVPTDEPAKEHASSSWKPSVGESSSSFTMLLGDDSMISESISLFTLATTSTMDK